MKYTPPDGRITVEFSLEGANVCVRVSDTGSGIPPEYHAGIFEKFGQVPGGQQRARYSTGLGLAFCRLAVEAHGGQIGVESEPDRGSTFWFALPAGASPDPRGPLSAGCDA